MLEEVVADARKQIDTADQALRAAVLDGSIERAFKQIRTEHLNHLMDFVRVTRDSPDIQAEFAKPRFLWVMADNWHRAKTAKALDKAFWEGQKKTLEDFDQKHGSSVATTSIATPTPAVGRLGAALVPVTAKTSAPLLAPAIASVPVSTKASAPPPAPAKKSAPRPAPAMSSVPAPVPALAIPSVPGPALAPAPPRHAVPASPLPSHPDHRMQEVVHVPPRKKVMTKAEGKRPEYRPEADVVPRPVLGGKRGMDEPVKKSKGKAKAKAKAKEVEELPEEDEEPEVVEVKPPPGTRAPKSTGRLRNPPCKRCNRLVRLCKEQVGGKACVECAKVKMKCEAVDEDQQPVATTRPEATTTRPAPTGTRPPKRKKTETSDEEPEVPRPKPAPHPKPRTVAKTVKGPELVESSDEEPPIRTFKELEEENNGLWEKVERLENQVTEFRQRLLFFSESNRTLHRQLHNQQADLKSTSALVQRLIRKVDMMEREAGEVGEKVGTTEQEVYLLWKEVDRMYSRDKEDKESDEEEDTDDEAPMAPKPVRHEPMDVDDLAPVAGKSLSAPRSPGMAPPPSPFAQPQLPGMAPPPPPFTQPPILQLQPPTPQTSQEETGTADVPVPVSDPKLLDVPMPLHPATMQQVPESAPDPMQQDVALVAPASEPQPMEQDEEPALLSPALPAPMLHNTPGPATMQPPQPAPPPTPTLAASKGRSRTRSPAIPQAELRRSQRQSRSPVGPSGPEAGSK